MITSAQKKALTEAGYSIKGDTVLNKSGKTVGGYNKNGNIFSGSSTVRDILKSKPEEKKVAAPKKAAAAKRDVTKPKQRQMGRGDGASEVSRRYSDTNSGKPYVDSTNPKQPASPGAQPSIKIVDKKSEKGNNKGPKEPIRREEDKAARAKSAKEGASNTAGRKARRDAKRKDAGANEAGMFIPGVAAVVGAGSRAKPRGSAYNPNYSGKPGGPTGFQGKYQTGVAKSGGRAAPLNLRGSSSGRLTGGAGKVVARNKFDEIMNMNKGGLVKANCGASMKPTQGKK